MDLAEKILLIEKEKNKLEKEEAILKDRLEMKKNKISSLEEELLKETGKSSLKEAIDYLKSEKEKLVKEEIELTKEVNAFLEKLKGEN